MIFRFQTLFLDWNKNFQLGENIFLIRNAIFRLQTVFLVGKHYFSIGSTISLLHTRFVESRENF